jgi:hypothetical protein
MAASAAAACAPAPVSLAHVAISDVWLVGGDNALQVLDATTGRVLHSLDPLGPPDKPAAQASAVTPASMHIKRSAGFDLSSVAASPSVAVTGLTITKDSASSMFANADRLLVKAASLETGVHFWAVAITSMTQSANLSIGVAPVSAALDLSGLSVANMSSFSDGGSVSGPNGSTLYCKRLVPGDVVGVLLDMDRHRVCFKVNNLPESAWVSVFALEAVCPAFVFGGSVCCVCTAALPTARVSNMGKYRRYSYS